jgi:hypothetical protein
MPASSPTKDSQFRASHKSVMDLVWRGAAALITAKHCKPVLLYAAALLDTAGRQLGSPSTQRLHAGLLRLREDACHFLQPAGSPCSRKTLPLGAACNTNSREQAAECTQ